MNMFRIDPLANLQQACALALQALPEIQHDQPEPKEVWVATLLEEDVKRLDEIGELFKSVRRLSTALISKSKRLQAQQVLFWDDVRTRYEAVRILRDDVPIGVRLGEEEGSKVIVKACIEERRNG